MLLHGRFDAFPRIGFSCNIYADPHTWRFDLDLLIRNERTREFQGPLVPWSCFRRDTKRLDSNRSRRRNSKFWLVNSLIVVADFDVRQRIRNHGKCILEYLPIILHILYWNILISWFSSIFEYPLCYSNQYILRGHLKKESRHRSLFRIWDRG
jgi:hypothetical protein